MKTGTLPFFRQRHFKNHFGLNKTICIPFLSQLIFNHFLIPTPAAPKLFYNSNHFYLESNAKVTTKPRRCLIVCLNLCIIVLHKVSGTVYLSTRVVHSTVN